MSESLEHEDQYDPDGGYDPRNTVGAGLLGAHAGQQESLASPERMFVQFEHKATVDMGGTSCFLNKRVNWFHRVMIRLCFGWKVTNQ